MAGMKVVHEDTPLTLDKAAQTLLNGVVKAATLRAAIHRGELAFERLGRTITVTARDVKEWREFCRVKPKERGSMQTADAVNGSSVTGHDSSALAALLLSANRLIKPSLSTSQKNTSQPSAAVLPMKRP